MMLKGVLLLAFSIGLFSSTSFAQRDYPLGPDPVVTPGSLCKQGNKRYSERITYCERNVSTGKKRGIYQKYDQMGFRTGSKRGQFKIDHYIPLCIGGSNDESNLWPQHRSVYSITDKLEEVVCIKVQEGRLLQADAIALIKRGKNNLDEVKFILEDLNDL